VDWGRGGERHESGRPRQHDTALRGELVHPHGEPMCSTAAACVSEPCSTMVTRHSSALIENAVDEQGQRRPVVLDGHL